MPIVLAILTLILQAGFIIHVFKTGRPYWWGFVILSFPLIGCIVYYFIEIFPHTKDARKAEKLVRTLGKHIGGDKAFMRRVEEVEICGSVDNRLALARECMQRGLYEDAVRLYHTCMQGLYADDRNLLLGLSAALVEKADYAEARATLQRLQTLDPAFKPNETGLLRARTLEGLGEREAALQEYEALLPVYVGLEARYRHAQLLKTLGHEQQARNALAAIEEHARKHRVTHDDEVNWLRMTKQSLKS